MSFSEKLGSYYQRSAVVLFTTGVLIALANLASAVVFGIMDNYFPSSSVSAKYGQSLAQVYPDLSRSEIDRLLHELWTRSFIYEPFTQFRERPCAGKYVNVDKSGFRRTKGQGPWPPDRQKYYTIFLFGGSTTLGYGLPDHQTIASYLQEFLASAGLEREARTYNFGRGHYFSSQERVLFEKLIAAGFIPDMVIFIDGVNDFHYSKDEPRFTRHLEQLMERDIDVRQVLKKSSLGRVARALRQKVPTHLKDNATPNEDYYNNPVLIKNVIDRYMRNKKMIEGVSTAYDVKAIFVWQPSPTYGYDLRFHLFFEGHFDDHTYSKYGYPQMAEFAKQNSLGSNFLWCADIQEGIREPLYVDKMHYSAKMSRKLARRIFDLMRERDLL